MFGLCLGDAMGTQIESMPVGQAQVKTLPKNAVWTNHTSTTLCALVSLIEHHRIVPADIFYKYVIYRDDGFLGPLDSGYELDPETINAINRYRNFGHVKSAGEEVTATSLVRVLAVVLYVLSRESEPEAKLFDLTKQLSMMTHGSKLTSDCCKYFAYLLHYCITHPKVTKDELLYLHQQNVEIFKNFHRDLVTMLDNLNDLDLSELPKTLDEYNVLSVLQFALKCFYQTANFMDGLLFSVNLTCQSNLCGAIYGQIAGAFYGMRHMPLLTNIDKTSIITDILDHCWQSQNKI